VVADVLGCHWVVKRCGREGRRGGVQGGIGILGYWDSGIFQGVLSVSGVMNAVTDKAVQLCRTSWEWTLERLLEIPCHNIVRTVKYSTVLCMDGAVLSSTIKYKLGYHCRV
jgi:hypothetical protein